MEFIVPVNEEIVHGLSIVGRLLSYAVRVSGQGQDERESRVRHVGADVNGKARSYSCGSVGREAH